MSLFIGKLDGAQWAAYQAGRALSDRRRFMDNAREYKRSGSLAAMRTSVATARDCNRQYLKAVADFAKATKPARKRA